MGKVKQLKGYESTTRQVTENKGYRTFGHPEYIHISTASGNPSTFWISRTGKYYRSKRQAENDSGKNTVNPEEFKLQKSFWDQNKKTIIFFLGIGIIVAMLMWLWRTGTITYHEGRLDAPTKSL